MFKFNFLAAALAVSLAACSNSPPKAEFEALILAHQMSHCPFEEILSFEPVGDPNKIALYGRIQRSIQEHNLSLISTERTTHATGFTDRNIYRDNIGRQIVYDYYIASAYNSEVYRIPRTMQLCVYTTDKVNILDVTVDAQNPKKAVVIFTRNEIPTQFAAEILGPKYTGWTVAAASNTNREYSASMEKLDSVGWRVNSVSRRLLSS